MFSKVPKIKLLAAFALTFVLFAVSYGQETGGVKGKVRTESGNGIPNATIRVRQTDSDLKTVTADRNGNFIIDGLAPGKYNVLFDASGYSSGVLHNVEVRKKGIRDLGDRLMLTVDRGTLVLVQGSVFFKEGTSVTGAKIEVEEIAADGSTKKVGSSYTNSSGEFTFRRPPGRSKLRVTASLKGVKASKELDVEEAAIYRVAISLDLSRTERD
jgi:hypothetical protein